MINRRSTRKAVQKKLELARRGAQKEYSAGKGAPIFYI